MPRQRRSSTISNSNDSTEHREQELSSMYDYLAKIILLGPSGAGKSCLLHRFIKDEWRVLSSQTIGVEFASKIVKIGPPNRKKRIKLQLWDTAGTERFRSVSRSYYRGAAGAVLVYDVCNRASFNGLGTFLKDAKALASPQLTVLMAGNKLDIADGGEGEGETLIDAPPPSTPSGAATEPNGSIGDQQTTPKPSVSLGSKNTRTLAPDGREVSAEEAATWATKQGINVAVEVSALSGDGVEDVFTTLARTILTRIELGEIDPSDPQAGVQYGDYGDTWDGGVSNDGGSLISGTDGRDSTRQRRGRHPAWQSGMREWEDVFNIKVRRRRCC